MTVELLNAPFPVTYRELWLPPSINGNATLPTSVRSGHALTLTGARKATTADGVHFTGTATSNIVVAANAIQNAKAAFHITIRFKLDATFAAGAPADRYLFQKLLAADDYLRVYLKAADGKLYWEQGNGAGGIQFTLTSTTVSWTAGTWYIITVSLTDVPAQRLLVNGTVEDTDTIAAVATPNGGDMVVGSSSAGGVNGIIGVISWVVIGVGTTAATALTTTEQTDLSKGVSPPTAKVQYMYLMDEGRGVTATDRGSAAGNGTLDSACTWAFGQVEQPVLSVNGLGDLGTSAAGVDIGGTCTLVEILKVKTVYNTPTRDYYICNIAVDINNYIAFYAYLTLRFDVVSFGTIVSAIGVLPSSIDQYLVLIGTVDAHGNVCLYKNGTIDGTSPGAGARAGPAIANIGAGGAGFGRYDISSPLFVALIDGAFTAKQALIYSRWLKNIFNLPISV